MDNKGLTIEEAFNKLNEAEGRTTWYRRATYWEPEEWDGVVISDFSGTKIDSEEDTWVCEETREVGTQEEVENAFKERELTILEPGSPEWADALAYMRDKFDLTEEDFNDPKFAKVSDGTYVDVNDTSWLEDIMFDMGYHQIGWDSEYIYWDEPDEPDED